MATSFDFGGLLGSALGGTSALDDLLTPEQRAAIRQQGALSAAAALLQAAGPSTTRTTLGQALGSAFAAGQAGMQKGTESALTQMLTRQKLEEAKREAEANKRYLETLQGLRTPAGEAGAMTAEQALAAPGMAVGPTVERAALVGQPVPAGMATGMAAGRPVGLTDAQLSLLQTLPRAQGAQELLKLLTPKEQEIISEQPIKTKTGYVQRTKSGGFIQLPKDYEPAAKPKGEPQVRTELSTGKEVLVQEYDDGTYQTIQGFGPPRKLREVQAGGTVQLIDEATIPRSGMVIPKTLAPQVVGGAESGYFVVGGAGGRAAPAAGGAASAAAPADAPAAAGPGAAAAPRAAAVAPAAAPAAGLQPIIPGTGKAFQNEKDMRAEFTTAMKPYVELSQAFQKIESAAKNPSGAGDISLVYGYMKILDPGSVVREGEFATAANAGGVPDAVRNIYNRAINGQRLGENVRADFLSQARNLIESQRELSNDVIDRYKNLASQYRLNPDAIVFDPFKRVKKPEEIIRGATPAAPAAPARPSSGSFFERFNLIPR